MHHNRISGVFKTLLLVVTISLFLAQTNALRADNAIDTQKLMSEASLSNGKSIYNEGEIERGARIPIQAGPNWLHVDGGGCTKCHGPQGLGSLEPDMCFITTPPITYRYLAGDGYPLAARQDGSHPKYTLHTLKLAVQAGIKPNEYDMDYCMPRWRFSKDSFRDLVAYLIHLDTSEK